jgi:hypothetical protein
MKLDGYRCNIAFDRFDNDTAILRAAFASLYAAPALFRLSDDDGGLAFNMESTEANMSI